MTAPADRIVCAGCGREIPDDEPFPFRCPDAPAAADVDHVLRRELDLSGFAFPKEGEENPFLRYRGLLYSYRFARRHGMSDDDYVALVRELDGAVGRVDGEGFSLTPYFRSDALSSKLGLGEGGGLWIKDETGNVAGSHKARHLMGIALHLAVVEGLGLAGRSASAQRLAIASCGNAALAAAIVAEAAGRPLDVFIPPDADAAVVRELQRHGAHIVRCPRSTGDPPGDPCFHRFREATASGSLPFSVQGSENGIAIEGGATLGWELVAQHGSACHRPLDRLVVQVGGGALASSCIQAMEEAGRLGTWTMPRVHAVQSAGGHPLERAWRRVAAATLEREASRGADPPKPDADAPELAALLARADPASVHEALRHAAEHRSSYMWPWEEQPRSIAYGILDDETYDWLVIVQAMIESGGWPLVVSEEMLHDAVRVAHACTDVPVDATGTAGLAGVLALREREALSADEHVAVLFTGVER